MEYDFFANKFTHEPDNKQLIIEDFKPKVIRIMLESIYKGSVTLNEDFHSNIEDYYY